MTAPRIGITIYDPNADDRYHLPTAYVSAVRRAGGVPLLMPPGEPRIDEWANMLDGLVLTGGGDIDPELYAGDDHELVYDVSRVRDVDEIHLAKRLISTGLPALCICRGMQILNVACGGTLITHLPDTVGEEVAHRRPDRGPLPHDVSLTPGTRLAEVMGATEMAPNSWHHQALDRLGTGLDVIARAPDGVIEAVSVADRATLTAVQWHPEITAADDPAQQRLFDDLITNARQFGECAP